MQSEAMNLNLDSPLALTELSIIIIARLLLVTCPPFQAPESEVLHAVIRWGEHELLRIMDERGENRDCES